jgi:hypothetical protein
MVNDDDAADQPEIAAPRFVHSTCTMCGELQGANSTAKEP